MKAPVMMKDMPSMAGYALSIPCVVLPISKSLKYPACPHQDKKDNIKWRQVIHIWRQSQGLHLYFFLDTSSIAQKPGLHSR